VTRRIVKSEAEFKLLARRDELSEVLQAETEREVGLHYSARTM
jgi:hypothetical protein